MMEPNTRTAAVATPPPAPAGKPVTADPGTSVDMNVGGQAVIEGVMMRSPTAIATAVRLPDGTIEVKKKPYTSLIKRLRFLNIPILRGAISFFEMLAIGIDTLNWSADMQMQYEDRQSRDGEQTRWDKWRNGLMLGGTMVVALAAALGIFFAVPILIATFLGLSRGAVLFNLVAGAIRLALFVLYIYLIAKLPDIRRIFRYHGAEHMSIFALEASHDLVVDSVRPHSRFHPRCGTSFILIVALFSMFLFGIADSLFIVIAGHPQTLAERLITHISLLPLVGGISFELLKLSGKMRSNRIVRFLTAPGLWLQRITTAEPDDDMLEVALCALKAAIGTEESPS